MKEKISNEISIITSMLLSEQIMGNKNDFYEESPYAKEITVELIKRGFSIQLINESNIKIDTSNLSYITTDDHIKNPGLCLTINGICVKNL